MKLKYSIIVLAALFAAPAFAADVAAVKARPVVQRAVPYDDTAGWTYGVSMIGATAKISVPQSGQPDNTANASAGAVLGYTWGVPTNWFGLEAGLYKNMTGADDPTPTYTGRVRAIWGGPVQTFLALIPNAATQFPVLQTPPSAYLGPFPYVYAVGSADNLTSALGHRVQLAGGVGLGFRQKLNPSTAMDYFSDCVWSIGSSDIPGPLPGMTAAQTRKCVAGITVSH